MLLLFCLILIYFSIGFILAVKEKKQHVDKAKQKQNSAEIVNPNIYDGDYFLYAYSGNEEEYIKSLENLPVSLASCYGIANPQPGEKVLDLGCGRGELAYYCVLKGCEVTALDYSASAAKLANKTRSFLSENLQSKMTIKQIDFIDLDENEKYDVIFMADLVEHLYDRQLKELFNKAKRVLKKDTGRIAIHTAPNKFWINFIFPLKRILDWLSTIRKKKKFFYERSKYFYDPEMHVNEQTPRSLKHHLKDFKAKVWCNDGSSNVISQLTKHFAGADIWAIARLK